MLELIEKHILSSVSLKANYENVDEEVNVKTVESITNLINTETRATLSMDRDNLSTLVENEGVELRIALNNASTKSDLYGHSEFEIELPESIEKVEIQKENGNEDVQVIHGDNLYVSSVETNGRTIRVVLDGKQTEINSIDIEKGTFINIKANIKVNLFTPSKTEYIKLRYSNDEATNYYQNGEDEIAVVYSAPAGVITANSIYNYNDKGDKLTSVLEYVEKTDLIDVYAGARVATTEIVMMNNNQNKISDISILGRFPFEGVKDIASDSSLGTTVTPRIVRGIESDISNNAEFKVLYSYNENATKEYNEENGWRTAEEIELENAKSYLIIPADENYLMEENTVLKFTYEFEIPENLSHNESIYGTFMAYYTNIIGETISREQSIPDLVGLTTGAGPEVKLELNTNRDRIKELGELRVELIAENIGKDRAEDVAIEFNIPENSKYVDTISESTANIRLEDNKLLVNIPELEVENKVSVTVILKAGQIPENMEDVEAAREGHIIVKASITAKDLGTVLESETKDILIEGAEFEITETEKVGAKQIDVYTEGKEITYTTTIRNIKNVQSSNIVATKVLPEELELDRAYIKYADGTEKEASK